MQGIGFERQVRLPIEYKGIRLSTAFVQDVVVENLIVLELKSVDEVTPLHKAQLLSYLRLSNRWLGLLIDFNVTLLSKGVERVVNGDFTDPSL